MPAKTITTAAATAIAAGVATLAPPAFAATPPVSSQASQTGTKTPATFMGTNGNLTITKGDGFLHFAGVGTSSGTTEQMPSQKVQEAEWAPDGSRVAYIDENGDLVSVRANGTDLIVVAPGVGTGTHPTWMNGGSFLVYASGGQLFKVPSLGGAAPSVLTAGAKAGDKDADPQGGANGALVFDRTDSAGHKSIWVYNGYTDKATGLNTLGSMPSISPDGKTIAFLLADNSATPVKQVWSIPADGSAGAQQLTFNPLPAQQAGTPVWSPDGTQLAFAVSGGIVTMAPTPQAPQSAPVATITGRLSWQPISNNNLVERLDGLDRITTAIEASKWSWADKGTAAANLGNRKLANSAVIARYDIFADALSGSPLAAREGGPLLLTHTDTLSPDTLAELQRTLQPGAFVYIMGQTAAISQHTEDQIAAAGFRPTRVGGVDRFDTSVIAAKTIVPTYSTDPVTVLAATGMNFPDALAAGAVAGSRPNTVVVLTNDKTMPTATSNFLNSVPNKTVFGIGGGGAAALQTVNIPATPVVGADRFVTASLVAHTFFGGPQIVGIATGYNFPDALAGGALVGSAGGPLLLTGPTLLPTETANYLRNASGSISDAVMFGGPAVLDDGLSQQIGDLISLPGQWKSARNDPTQHLGPLARAS